MVLKVLVVVVVVGRTGRVVEVAAVVAGTVVELDGVEAVTVPAPLATNLPAVGQPAW